MPEIVRERIDRNQLWWVADGPGGHGSERVAPAAVVARLGDRFAFIEERAERAGLRPPQLGALHAILAQDSLPAATPITVVMPTGTGKTETMLAAFAHSPRSTLVVVPSDALRTQISTKFATLGVLPSMGVVFGDFVCPVVGVLRASFRSEEEADRLVAQSNVLVSTAAALARSTEDAIDRLVTSCECLYVDEAHHVAASTWKAIVDRFSNRRVVQFTATPFREDGQHLGGRIVYSYPLHLAQEHGYFAGINYRGITDLGDVDRSIASAAVARLRDDVEGGRDHVLMARVQTIPRASGVLNIYQEIAPDLGPVRLDSKIAVRAQRDALRSIEARSSRIVVCVDMLGEGFDLPALKVAAIHDPHKSLAVTLQFIGRFARTADADELGEASVFVPRHAGDIDERLRRLYGEDSDWNRVVRDLTEAEVDREQARSDFEESFESLPTEVALRGLAPKMSTVVFRSADLVWKPDTVYDLFGESGLLTRRIGISAQNHVVWFITEQRTPVRWGEFATFGEVVHHLYVVHAELDKGLLYVNSSDNSSVHTHVARAI